MQVAAVIAVVVVAVLAFGVFGVQGLFIDERVDEAAPAFAEAPSGLPGDRIPADMAAAMAAAMEGRPATETVREGIVGMAEPAIVRGGRFVSRSHATTGTASVITDGSGRRVLRLEDLETDNGPALVVYLSPAAPDAPKDDFAKDFVDLGRLKGNIGSQNYEIPSEADLSRYSTVVIWCSRFAVAFGAAALRQVPAAP